MDVKYVLAAFEEINKCQVDVRIYVEGTTARPDLILVMRALEDWSEEAEARPLALVKQTIGSFGPRTMEAAILQGMYALDAQMAEAEFAKTIVK